MRLGLRFFYVILLLLGLMSTTVCATESSTVPILCYHNLNPTRPGSMNMTPARFEGQLQWLKDNGFTIIPLKTAVEYLQGKRASLPAKPVVITVDDGWESVYRYMFPIIKKFKIPVTLFIYPQTISVGQNAMTWEQLKTLQDTGFFDIQSHTMSHPNFKHAKRSLSAAAYQNYLTVELAHSKALLEKKMNKNIAYLAWPFGIYNAELEQAAAKAGYTMAFTIDYRKANKHDRPMAEPRYMIVEPITTKTFASLVGH